VLANMKITLLLMLGFIIQEASNLELLQLSQSTPSSPILQPKGVAIIKSKVTSQKMLQSL